MPWRLAGSLVTLRNEINAAYPGRAKVSDGSIGDAAHSARTSDHNPDAGGVVRAIDVTQDDPFHTATPADDVAEAVAEFLRAGRDHRVKYVIWRGRMFSSYATSKYPAWTWRPYSGANGHFHHVHVSVQPGGPGDGGRAWGFTRPGGYAPVITRRWLPFGPGHTDRTIAALGGEPVEISEVQMILTALADDWNDPELDPHGIDGAYSKRTESPTRLAIVAYKKRMVQLQMLTGQQPWQVLDGGVGPNTIAALRFWNGVRGQ